jgi:hypothetical protein
MQPEKFFEKSVSEIEPGLQARITKNFLIKYKATIKKLGIPVILINQMSTQIRFMGATTIEPAGGQALKFYSDIRILAEQKSKLEKNEDTLSGKQLVTYGNILKVWAMKNRHEKPFIAVDMAIIFGKGISNILAYKQFLEKHGRLKMSGGGYYSLDLDGSGKNIIKAHGLPKLQEVIRDHAEEVQQTVNDLGGFILLGESYEDEES